MNAKPSKFLYLEKKIAELLGLQRKDLRFVRRECKLKKRKDYSATHRDIVLTEAAARKILAYVKETLRVALTEEQLAQCLSELSPAEKKEDATQELIVKRCLPNERLLLATDPAGGEVTVRVMSNRKFLPKMSLRAVFIGNQAGQPTYQMEGRCPRIRGHY